jgi:peptidyl-prolyl cis-trans isomerase C
MRSRLSRLIAASALALLVAGGARAQFAASPPPDHYGLPALDARVAASFDTLLAGLDRSPGLVVANVGTDRVTWGDVADSLRAMPRVVTGIPFEQLYQTATLQVMARKALAQAAVKRGVDAEPAVAARMKNAAEDVLASEFLRRSLEPALSEAALRPVYDKEVAPKIVIDQVRARIIMVASAAQASDLIAQLEGGADFGDLARQFSKDGTAAAGGDLGFVRLPNLAPEIGAVIFALAPGQTTRFPVRSGAFWFVIRIEARGQVGAPGFAEAREDLARDVMRWKIPELKLQALRDVDVSFMNVPVPAGSTPPNREALAGVAVR